MTYRTLTMGSIYIKQMKSILLACSVIMYGRVGDEIITENIY